ncbi:MAG: PIG-L family deacetylase, partial [Acidimicrobiales bacterium]
FEVGEVWMIAGRSPDRFVDITDHIEAKIAALCCHRTQITEPDKLAEMIRAWGLRSGLLGGLPDGRMAEAFQFVDTR